MKRLVRTLVAVAVCLSVPVLSAAVPIPFTIPGGASNPGTLSLLNDGDGTVLFGNGIALSFDGTGGGAPTPGVLDFTSYYTKGWSVPAGGALNIYSPDYSLLLVTGTFVSGAITPGAGGEYLLDAAILDILEPGFAAGYGLMGGLDRIWAGSLQIRFGPADLAPGGEFASLGILGGSGTTQPVPEPGTVVLLGSALAGLSGWRLRARRGKAA